MNRHSRQTMHELRRIHELLHTNGVRVAAFHVVANHAELARCARRAAKSGAPVVVAGGGDGTMAHAVDALAHRETILGVLPLGTGNSFARSLGLDPHDLGAAVRTIAGGNVERIDLGRVNGTYFANFATIGISSEIAGATPSRVKSWSGPLAYALAAIRPLLTHRAFRARIRWKGGRLDVRTQDVIVANGRFFGTAPVTPDATLTDGRLALFTTEDASRAGALRTYLAFGAHAQDALRHAHVVTAKRFTIRTRARQTISIDGALLERTPARFRVAREALRVFVPEHGVASP
ncbi:MAG TPA: YegS/Rv2252/BmrU family lipid kinase [Candidatus Elarobacter sp.]|nr:YegS/Rv2252/BmrU family lipid kinase [Candidatus Elarobacter sp.]